MQRADVIPAYYKSSNNAGRQPVSNLASTLRNGQDEWDDTNSFVYTDPRLDGNNQLYIFII